MKVLAFDLGSNTLRAVLYDCVSQAFEGEFERIVKTADKLVQTGRIDDAAAQRVISAIREALQRLQPSDEVRIVAYATEAMRRAANAEAVLAMIANETGVRFDVIDGEREAQLTLLAVGHRLAALGNTTRRFVLVDIGGGSTELTFVCDENVVTRSFPVGIVTVAQAYGELDRIEAAMPTLSEAMRAFADEVTRRYGKCDTFVATAGTPTTVAAMKLGQTYATYDAKHINGTRLHKEELRVYLERLLAMPFDKREETVGVGRSDLIAAGIVIFEAIYAVVGLDECVVIDDGLREGAALAACNDAIRQKIIC